MYEEEYRRANRNLHPSEELVERAAAGAWRPGSKRRTFRLKVTSAVAAVLALVLLVTGIPGLGEAPAGGPVAGTAYALARPTLPQLPAMPEEPASGGDKAWEQFSEDYETYWEAWRAFRKESAGIDEQAGLMEALAAFSGQSTALALSGSENQIYSPLSLWFALAMLAETTDGESRREILDVLGAEDVQQLRAWADSLWHALYTDDGASALLLGSSIWLNESVEFRQEAVDALAEHYYASSFRVPMGQKAADQALSDWVAEQTRGLIGGEEKVLETNSDMWMVLASTLYYKAVWTSEFRADRTQPDTFTSADGSQSTVDFMHKTRDANFLRREGYQAASLPTSLGEMVFVLPDEGVAPEELLRDPEFLSGLDLYGADGISGEVQWSVPKFDVQSTLQLEDYLKTMGITAVFDEARADFSPLSGSEMWLEQAKQIARVKVDEKGVEAAAVTLMAAAGSAAPPEDPKICVMDLDRPFLFIIRQQGVVLFAGVVQSL